MQTNVSYKADIQIHAAFAFFMGDRSFLLWNPHFTTNYLRHHFV